MKRLLITGDGYTEAHGRTFEMLGFVVDHYLDVSRNVLELLLPDLDAYVLGGDERLDAALLGCARKLKLISVVGTGVGTFVDQEAASRLGIALRNTPGLMTQAVAEHTVGLMLGMGRGLFAQNDSVKRGAAPSLHSKELADIPIGIVGLGAIGARVARTIRQIFGCEVSYSSITRKPDLENELGLRYASIPSLFSDMEMICLLLPSSESTRYFVGKSLLACSRPDLILINTATATLVEPHALRNALVTGQIKAAAFDGYYIEPLPAAEDDPYGLLTLPDSRFVVTPHTAAKTARTWSRMVERAVENLVEYFDKEFRCADR